MAKNGQANGGDDGPTTGHNVADIHAAIQKCNQKAHSLQQQIDAAVEKYVKPLKDEQTKLFRNTKADTTVPIKVLKAHYKLFHMAREAANDEDNGPEVLDAMRITFEGMQKGGQLDWLEAVDMTQDASGPPPFMQDTATDTGDSEA